MPGSILPNFEFDNNDKNEPTMPPGESLQITNFLRPVVCKSTSGHTDLESASGHTDCKSASGHTNLESASGHTALNG